MLWSVSWATSAYGPVMPLYIRSIGIEVEEWGILVMFNAAGMILFEWVWGILSDRLNRQILMAVSLLCMSILFPLFTLKALVPYFFILQFLLGSFAVIIGPTTRAIISDKSPVKSIGLSMSLWFVFITLGQIVGPLVGSYIAQVRSFEYSFYLSSIISFIGALTVLIGLCRSKGQRSHLEKESSQSVIKGFKTLISTPSIRALFLLAVFTFIASSVVTSFLPIYASERIGMSTVEVGMVLATMSALQLTTTPIFGKLYDRVGKKNLIIISLAFSSLMLLCYFFVKTASQLLLVSIGLSIVSTQSPLLLAMLSEITPRKLSGMSMGVYGSFEDLGIMIGPPIYGLIWSTYAPSFIFVVSAAVQLLNILLVLIMFRSIKNKTGVL